MGDALLRILKLPFIPLSAPAPDTFDGLTVLITGASGGLGLAAAQHIARTGATHLILAVRDLSKGAAAKSHIEHTEGVPSKITIDVWALDLEDFKSVRALAARATADLSRLDVAIMNAGCAPQTWGRTAADGWERATQVNVLSTGLLALLLLPLLGHGPAAHLTFVASEGHCFVGDFEERHSESILNAVGRREGFDGNPVRYYTTKLLQLYVAREIACLVTKRYGSAVVVNSVNPGYCRTELLREPGMLLAAADRVFSVFARSPEKGALTIVDAAAKGLESHGCYLDHQNIVQ